MWSISFSPLFFHIARTHSLSCHRISNLLLSAPWAFLSLQIACIGACAGCSKISVTPLTALRSVFDGLRSELVSRITDYLQYFARLSLNSFYLNSLYQNDWALATCCIHHIPNPILHMKHLLFTTVFSYSTHSFCHCEYYFGVETSPICNILFESLITTIFERVVSHSHHIHGLHIRLSIVWKNPHYLL